MRLYYDERGIVRVAGTTPIITNIYRCVEVDEGKVRGNPVGRKVVFGDPSRGVRLAVVCNWGDACGIATYSRYLLDAIRPLVDDVKVFAEDTEGDKDAAGYDVDYCWRRGRSMADAARRVRDWRPTVVLIQHEFGLFPRAPFLLQMLQMLDAASLPYAVTLHSVYEHLDKVVCTAPMRNVVVHSAAGKECLERLGHTARIRVIPHGCVAFDAVEENWNITHTPHAIIQFGFGFRYKGVERALGAVARLKRDQPEKYRDVHYCYLCSESPHVRAAIGGYHDRLVGRIEEWGLADNAVVIRGFQPDAVLNQYLRTYKLAVFPYETDPKNVVYGASGAVRLAMANRIPTIASRSHMFDDLVGVLPRPDGEEELAAEIDRIFASRVTRDALVATQDNYVRSNTWTITARRYLHFLDSLVDANPEGTIYV